MSSNRDSEVEIDSLAEIAKQARWQVMKTVTASKAGHVGGPLSAIDMLVALYFRQLRVNPQDPQDVERDRFILSKGHSAIGLYSVLALRGYFPVQELVTFDQGDSRLQGHPDMLLTPGVDTSTGSLGQGLASGAGIALAAKRRNMRFHTWVMVGDGELEEGMIWETVICAPRYALDNLTLIVDLNGLQQYGWAAGPSDRFDRSEPMGHVDLCSVFKGFGWNVVEIDGHDFEQILESFAGASGNRGVSGRPTVIVANTTKGRGVSFAEGTYKWHNGVATAEELALAHAELGIVEPSKHEAGTLA
jgi:transketolase